MNDNPTISARRLRTWVLIPAHPCITIQRRRRMEPHIFGLFGPRTRYEPAPKGNKFAVGNKGGGRHSQFDPKFIRRAELACRAGFTDKELAELFDVSYRQFKNGGVRTSK